MFRHDKPASIQTRLLGLCMSMLLLASCGGGGSGQGGNAAATTTVTVTLGQVGAKALGAPGVVPANVQSISVEAFDAGGARIAGPVFANAPNFTVTLTLPNGSGIQFVVKAFAAANGKGTLLYQGSATADLTGTPVTLPVVMSLAIAVTASAPQVGPGFVVQLAGTVAGQPPTATSPLIWTASGGTLGTPGVNGGTITWKAPSTLGSYTITAKVNPAVNPDQDPNITGSVTVQVINNPPTGKYVYVNDNVDAGNTVSGFVIDQTTGALTPITGSPFATGGLGNFGTYYGANNIAVNHAKNLLFATNRGSNDISVFHINPATGVLTAVAGSPFANLGTMGIGGAIEVNQAGTLLFVGNDTSGSIGVFRIAADGSLTEIAGSPFTAGATVDGIRLNADGTRLYVTDGYSIITIFNVAADGTLTTAGTVTYASGGIVTSIDLNNTGVAVAAATGGHIQSYTVDPTTGALTPAATLTLAGAANQQSVTFTHAGDRVVVSGGESVSVAVVDVAAGGGLTDVVGSAFATTHWATGYAAVHPNDRWVYVSETLDSFAGIQNYVELFSMAPDGSLTSGGGVGANSGGYVTDIVIY